MKKNDFFQNYLKPAVSNSKSYNYLLLDDDFFQKYTSFNNLSEFDSSLKSNPNKDEFIQINTSFDCFESFNSGVIGHLAGGATGSAVKLYLKEKKKRT